MSAGKVPAYVLGVGMTKFVKPRGKVAYTELGFEAGVKALLDAHVTYDDVDQGVACYCYGDSTCGQRVFYQFGMTGIPIYNVNNNCSTGSTGLHMARQLVAHGAANCVLVVGFEQMQPGSFQTTFKDRPEPMGRIHEMVNKTSGLDQSGVIEIFGNAAREYISKYGATAADFAEVARLNHNHSQRNPYSQFTDSYSLEQILQSPMIYTPLTKLQCCPTSDGAAAVVVVSQQFLDARPHLKSQAILIAGQHLATDSPQLYSENPIDLTGYEMSKRAAKIALAEARVLPREIKVIELHDCFSANEICVLDALGISEPGKAHETVRAGDITYGGRFLVNPSGGLISKGHPLGATGLAQCAELTWQLRGWANNRSIPGTVYCLQHNLGLGGAVVVTVYTRFDGLEAKDVSDAEVIQMTGLPYNPATHARGFTIEQANSVCSKSHRSEWALQNTPQKVQARF